MDRQQFIASEVERYETVTGQILPVDNKGVLREMKGKEFDWWKGDSKDFQTVDYGEEKEIRYD